MTKAYFTRKDLIAIALGFLYTLLLLFVGACIDGAHMIISKRNPIFLIAQALHFKTIEPGIAGFIMLALVAVYVSLFIAAILYERRFAKANGIKAFSVKMVLVYLLTLLACLALSFGVGVLFQPEYTAANIQNAFLFIGYTVALTTMIYLVLFLLFGGIVMLVTNFVLIDKPFRFFGKDDAIIEDEEEEEADLAASFDTTVNAGAQGGTVDGGTTTTDGSVVVDKAVELDDAEKVFPGLTKIDLKYGGFANETFETDDVTLEELCVKFRNYLAYQEKLYFDIDTIRVFISSLSTSHFMILEGLSGTGKSSLPRYFAKFVSGDVLFMPVQAIWRDKTNIVGYFNDFSKTYNETDFLVRLYDANYNPDKIYFFVLDEMNISRVEYYFADLLSVLEYPTDEWYLRLMHLPHNFVAPVKILDGFIKIPDNVYFVGTANKDDSTFTISDKVYDRAITIDFDYRNEPFEVESGETIKLSKSKLHSLFDEALSVEDNKLTAKDLQAFNKISDFVYDQFDITFGNRILNQIETLVPVYIACGGTKEDALDFLLSRKILVKIEGRFEDYVKSALQQLLQLLNEVYGEHTFKRSERIINKLIRRL